MAPCFFLHISSRWVKIRLYTENQLPSLPGSALKVPVVGWFPTHYQVKLQLMLRLIWAVTTSKATREKQMIGLPLKKEQELK